MTLASVGLGGSSVQAATASQIVGRARAGLDHLYSVNKKAKFVGARARAILVFPGIEKAWCVAGAQRSDGVLFIDEQVAGYYNTSAASYGFQERGQPFDYVLFFMDDQSLAHLRNSGGWGLSTGPSIGVVDEGVATTLSTTTMAEGIYAFFVNQRGLMPGMGLQETKITRYNPGE